MSDSVPHTKIGDMDVSRLCLGTWQFGDTLLYVKQTPEVEAAIVKNAFECGINFFDTAEAYNDGQAEIALGKALKASGREREEYVVATKVNGACLKPENLRRIVQRSLDNLQTDYVDLMQIHWPNDEVRPTVYMPILNEFVEEGKIRNIGISNHGVGDMTAFMDAGYTFATNQLPFNLLNRVCEDEIIPFVKKNSAQVLAYSPLGQGLLTGKYMQLSDCPPGLSRSRYFHKSRSPISRHGEDGCEEQLFKCLHELKQLADENGYTMAQLSLAWLMRQDVASVIFGASKPEHVASNVQAARISLSPQVVAKLDEVTQPVKTALNGNPDLWNHVSRVH